jgi:Na+/H+-dicarboxylate symporter
MTKALFILAALILGLLAGIGFGQIEAIKSGADTIGSVWLNALRMTVVPLVVTLLITGIAQTALAARAGRLAARGVGTMLAILWGSSILAAVMIPLI